MSTTTKTSTATLLNQTRVKLLALEAMVTQIQTTHATELEAVTKETLLAHTRINKAAAKFQQLERSLAKLLK